MTYRIISHLDKIGGSGTQSADKGGGECQTRRDVYETSGARTTFSHSMQKVYTPSVVNTQKNKAFSLFPSFRISLSLSLYLSLTCLGLGLKMRESESPCH